jgi:DNA-3-methyladenine glycosylase II
VNYVQNVARFQIEHGMEHERLSEMENEEVIEYLTQIKGVGRWTSEMLLMFAMCREDIFAPDDLGIQTAMIRLYKLDNSNKKKLREDLLRVSKKWSPYRTYACLYMWRMKDNQPVGKVKDKVKNKVKVKGKVKVKAKPKSNLKSKYKQVSRRKKR